MNGVPVIIGSAPSSGSTLLVNLLGRVEGMYQTHELSIFDKPDWIGMDHGKLKRSWGAMLQRGYRRRLACEMRSTFNGLSRPLIPTPRPREGYLALTTRFMGQMAQQNGCRRWVEKTPANVFSIPKLLHHMPEAKFIVITRDARPAITSLLRRGYSPVVAAARWYLSNLIVRNVMGNPAVLRVTYEGLVTNPASTLRTVMDFIDEPFVEEMLNPVDGQKPIASWSASPSEEIRTVGLWAEDAHFDIKALSALLIMRATSRFATESGLEEPAPSPAALQRDLDYPELESSGPSVRPLVNHMDMAVASARYASAMLYYRLLPREVPFSLRGT